MFSWFGKVSFVSYSKVQDFAVHLKDGRLMGSTCKGCGYTTFPPRADCPECNGGEFEFHEYSEERYQSVEEFIEIATKKLWSMFRPITDEGLANGVADLKRYHKDSNGAPVRNDEMITLVVLRK